MGLLLLRAAIGVQAIIYGAVAVTDASPHPVSAYIVAALAIVSGLALVAGFLTPIAGGLTVLGGAGLALWWPASAAAGQFETRAATGLILVVGLAVVLLGPGALSLDARLFGRREIIIPRAPRSPNA